MYSNLLLYIYYELQTFRGFQPFNNYIKHYTDHNILNWLFILYLLVHSLFFLLFLQSKFKKRKVKAKREVARKVDSSRT